MPTLTFKLDQEKDIHNAWELCNIPLLWAEPSEKKPLEIDYKELWKNRSFEDCREEILKSVEKLYSLGIVEAFRTGIEKSWIALNDSYFERLERITRRQIYTDNFTAYVTTVGRCPYNIKDNSFMLSIKRPLLQCLRTSGHELMHLQFSHYFWKKTAEQINNEKADSLNEALTVLLNLEFRDLWLVEDEGYPMHKELRGFISKEWKKESDFDTLIEKCIEYFKGK